MNQELKIKKDFAMELYYKRLLDRTLSSLKVYKTYKKVHREERQRSVSHEIQQEYHRQSRGKLSNAHTFMLPKED